MKNFPILSTLILCSLCSAADFRSDDLKFERLGKLKIGQNFEDLKKDFGGQIHCVPKELWASKNCYHTGLKHNPEITLMILDGKLVRIDLTATPGRAASGIAIGDNITKLIKRYPQSKRIENTSDLTAEFLIISDDRKYAMKFYLTGSIVTAISSGTTYAMSLDEGCF
ncbi:hypothetical protein [Duganella callida]|uniref:Uncharacterized protein n=1 Tax=Duganella callida TaxID=2561932 RepID=A0A4Y9S8P2_9BURK|nr:hypothetical protein [Duganella callida]TFW15906.1 hypothetical protein E4L98_24715 [Duganella callida]